MKMQRTVAKSKIINGPAPSATALKFWDVASVSDDEGELTLYGEVCSKTPVDWWTGEPLVGQYITPEGFLEDLATIKNKGKITVKLNSVGGDLYTGIAIHNAIKGLAGSKTVIVEGIAASAASVIMCAGDAVEVYPGSMVMIHGVSAGLCDYYNITDLKQVIKGFDAAEKAIAEIYAAKTGTDVDTLRSMITKETWMTGKEAIEKGFADTLLDGTDPQMSLISRDILLVNGVQHNIKGLNIPPRFNIQKQIFRNSISAPEPPVAGINNTLPTDLGGRGGKTVMATTIDELKKECPDLVAQLVNETKATATTESVAAERARLKAIEEIKDVIGDPQLVKDAMYGEKPCTAEELAFKAMQKQAKLGTAHLEGVTADFAASGASKVGAAPNNGTDGDNAADEKQQIDGIVNLFNNMNGGKK